MLETNIDNMSSEVYSYLFPKLLENGALDVYVTPIYMKKTRPASKLSVMCGADDKAKLEEIIFRETLTIGIRNYEVGRTELKRSHSTAVTKYGNVRTKTVFMDDEVLRCYPEYEDCAKIAAKYNVPFQQIYNDILKELENKINRRV